jgi:hypothetical protein
MADLIQVNSARMYALVDADPGVRVNSARVFLLVEGPLTAYTPAGGATGDGFVQGERLRRQATIQGQRLKPWAALKP